MTVDPITPITAEQVRLLGDQLLIDGLTVDDEATITLAREREQAGESLDELVSQAIEIGARILQREQTASDTEFVKAEFERQAHEVEQQFNESAQKVSEGFKEKIDATFDADAGLLPKLLDQYFGENSSTAVQKKVEALVQEMLRTHREALTKQFTADDENNPLNQFQKAAVEKIKTASDIQSKQLLEMTRTLNEMQQKMAAAEGEAKGADALAAEHAKSAAKGRPYEESVAAAIAEIAHGRGDISEHVGEVTEGGGKKGDVVVDVEAQNGPPRGRIAFEAKNVKEFPRGKMIKTLDDARHQRSAGYAVLVVPTDPQVPANTRVLEEIHGDKLVITYDPDSDSTLVLETGYALARARLLMAREEIGDIDVAAVTDAAEKALETLAAVKKIKASLTGAKTQIDASSASVDEMANRVREHLDAICELTRADGDDGDDGDDADENADATS